MMKDIKITREPVSFEYVMAYFRGLPHHMISDHYFMHATRWWELLLFPTIRKDREFNIFRKSA